MKKTRLSSLGDKRRRVRSAGEVACMGRTMAQRDPGVQPDFIQRWDLALGIYSRLFSGEHINQEERA